MAAIDAEQYLDRVPEDVSKPRPRRNHVAQPNIQNGNSTEHIAPST